MLMMNMDVTFENPHRLDYTIHSCSSCSPNYHPFNIIEDAPTEPSSRWSGSGPPNPSVRPTTSSSSTTLSPAANPSMTTNAITNAGTSTSTTSNNNSSHLFYPSRPSQSKALASLTNPGQLPKKKEYIIIDLGKPCIVRSVTFGKFHRPHPCSVKLFRIWGSLAPGEGKGEFKALLDAHIPGPITQNPDSGDHSHPNPSHSQYSRTHHRDSSLKHLDHLLGSDIDESSASSTWNKSSRPPHQTQRIRVRGERHTSGPRMELLAQGELKNDPLPETVQLRWKNNSVPWFKISMDDSPPGNAVDTQAGIVVPIRYLKIEPLSAAGSNYNCSIWHISVKGHDEDYIVQPCLERYEKWKASAALRLCLKHLRRAGHMEAFQALIRTASNPQQSPTLIPPTSGLLLPHVDYPSDQLTQAEDLNNLIKAQPSDPAYFHFEHSLASALYSTLFPLSNRNLGSYSQKALTPAYQRSAYNTNGWANEAEQIVLQASSDGLFDDWARAQPPTLTCLQFGSQSEKCPEVPCPRGGHQMCIDSRRRKIWLFGGFDGLTDLADLWVYHLPSIDGLKKSEDLTACKSLRKDSALHESPANPKNATGYQKTNETAQSRWELISRDVKKEKGPINRSCHKMVLDELTGDLYILGRYSERSRAYASKLDHTANDSALKASWIDNSDPRLTPTRSSGDMSGFDNGSRNTESEQTGPSGVLLSASAAEGMKNLTEAEVDGNKDPSRRAKYHFKNDFFRFQPFKDLSSSDFLVKDGQVGLWECISCDTEADGGPKLIFDHQMVLDSESRKIYVFGGKIIQSFQVFSGPISNQYSGLFEYDLKTRSWINVMSDPESGLPALSDAGQSSWIPSRMGHSLVLDKKRQCLWILAGERDSNYYSDLWKYNLRTRQSELVNIDYTYSGPGRSTIDVENDLVGTGPEAGFSQRTTFDAEADEWHMFCGLCRDRSHLDSTTKAGANSEIMSSEFWRWRISDGKWSKVVMMAEVDGMGAPPPRFAHQMVFDELTKYHYVFGGNPADNDNEPNRLGDFWRLKLIQPSREEALRKCFFALRRQHFIELCEEGKDAVGALAYLQNDLFSVTNHLDEQEARLFRACTSHLLTGPGSRSPLLEDDLEPENRGSEMYEDFEMNEPEDCVEGGVGEFAESDDVSTSKWTADDFDPDRREPSRRGMRLSRKLRDQRTKLFENILNFFPPSMTEPEESLIDLIDVWGDRETFW